MTHRQRPVLTAVCPRNPAARTVYHLSYSPLDDRWHLAAEGDGTEALTFPTKNAGRQAGERLGRGHVARGERALLLVHGSDGTTTRTYTYGDPDPDGIIHRLRGWFTRTSGQTVAILRSPHHAQP